ncbi:trypsin-1-like [Artemia franciscana]
MLLRLLCFLVLMSLFSSCSAIPRLDRPREGSADEEVVQTKGDVEELCGIAPNGAKIVGGNEAVPGEFPWMAGIFLTNRGYPRLFCGGSLIDHQHILTAAHCVNQTYHRPQPADLVVRLNEFDISSKDDGLDTLHVNVEKIFVHPLWNEKEFKDDLAILRLEQEVDFDPNLVPVCLPRGDETFTSKSATVSGWGVTKEGGRASSTLRKASVQIEANEDCLLKYDGSVPFQILESNLCASNPPRDACQNDSGGPLVVQGDDERWTQVGIVSWGIGCGDRRFPGVYARISSYIDWIDSITQTTN